MDHRRHRLRHHAKVIDCIAARCRKRIEHRVVEMARIGREIDVLDVDMFAKKCNALIEEVEQTETSIISLATKDTPTASDNILMNVLDSTLKQRSDESWHALAKLDQMAERHRGLADEIASHMSANVSDQRHIYRLDSQRGKLIRRLLRLI